MDAIIDMFSRAIEQLLGRASGPLHFRLILQPIIASVLAIRAGLRDAREGQPAFLWTFLMHPLDRRELVQSGWSDLSKIFVVAIVLDTIYQLFVLHGFFVVQTLIVVAVVALLPYVVLRGPVARIARLFMKPSTLAPVDAGKRPA
jgi:hypothetical protein